MTSETVWLYATGVRHAAWSLLHFLPTELLYKPYQTHAHLQQECVSSLISAMITVIKYIIQPWYGVDLSSISGIFLALRSTITELMLLTALSSAVTVLSCGKQILVFFLDVTVSNIQATCQVLSACRQLGTFAVGMPDAMALRFIKSGGAVEDILLRTLGAWQTASDFGRKKLTVIGRCIVCMVFIFWTWIMQQLSRTPDYDSPETRALLASIRTGKANSRTKRIAPNPNKQRKTRLLRTAKAKASKTPLPSETSTAAFVKPQPQLERELQGIPMAAGVPDAARQSGDTSCKTDGKPAQNTTTWSADEISPPGKEDAKDLNSNRAQHNKPLREDLEASGEAESHRAAGQFSWQQSSAHLAIAPVTPTLAPHSHAQLVAQQQANPYSHTDPVSQPQAPASKAATAATSIATENLTTPVAAKPHTGAAAVTPHSTPAQFPHLFPSVPSVTPESVLADKPPKQHKPTAHSLMSSLPSSPVQSQDTEPRCAHKNAYGTAFDKAADERILFQLEASHTVSEDALTAHSTQGAGSLSDKSSKTAAGLPHGPSVQPGLTASAPSVADEQPCVDQHASSDDCDGASKCIICWTTDRETTLAPCGHRVLCRYSHTACWVFGTAMFAHPSITRCMTSVNADLWLLLLS